MTRLWRRLLGRSHAPDDAPSARPAEGAVATVAELVALRGRVVRAVLPGAPAVTARGGAHRSSALGRGLEFAEVRPYQPGDDKRSIDWRHTARRGRPCTKVFHAERERPVLLLIDLGPSMRFGTRVAFKSVLASRAAASVAWAAIDAGDRIGAVVHDVAGHRVVPAQPRTRGALAVIRALAAEPAPESQTDAGFATALRALGRVAPPGSRLVVFSDFRALDAPAGVELARLAAHHAVALVRVFDPVEAEAPAPGIYRVADANGELTLDLRAPAARDAYGASFRARGAALAALAKRLRAPLVPLATDADPVGVVHALAGHGRAERGAPLAAAT